MRYFQGEALTDEYMDDLVECWHDSGDDPEYDMSLMEFVMANTGLDYYEYQSWVISGEVPDE